MDTICVEGFQCPKCGSNIFDRDFVRMNLFVCAGTRSNGMPCNWLVCVYCETCGQHYTHENFIRQNGQFICKTCGQRHRQFGDYMRLVAKQYYETASPEEKRLLQIKQEAEAFAERMRREREAFDK